MNQDKLLTTIEKYTIFTLLFLIPLLVIPIFPNPFTLPKIALLSLGVSVLLLVKATKLISTGKLQYRASPYDLPVALIAISYLLSALFITPNKMEAFVFPGTATLVIASALLYFSINHLGKKDKFKAISTLFFSTAIASFVSVLVISGILEKIPQLPPLFTNPAFTTLSGPLPLLVLTLAMLPFGINAVIQEKEIERKALMGILSAIVAFGFLISAFNIFLANNSSNLLGYTTSWSVAVDAIKESPLFGVGPGNYLSAFNRFKPLTYNQTDNWVLRFTQSRSFYLTAITEVGFAVVASLILLLTTIYKQVKSQLLSKKESSTALHGPQISLVVLILSLITFNASPTILVALFTLLATSTATKKKDIELASKSNRTPAMIVAIPIIVGVGVFIFYSTRALIAEAKYQKALVFLAQNQGKQTYDTLRGAINLNPFVDRYHATYAQVNIALAQSLAQNPEITEEERSTIAQLIQQAIREGKATVTLNQQRAGNWEILATIYRAVMPFAQGADTFAVQTYSQAIALDPINPNLRINLGGIYFALGRYDEAIRAFELATLAKPDLANSHYNLAAAYREKEEIEKAINELELVLVLVDEDSQDYLTAKAELESLEERKLEPVGNLDEETSPETLTPPQPAENPALTPPLDLPEEASPPPSEAIEAEEESTTPAPTPTLAP